MELKKIINKYIGNKGSFRRNSLIMSSGASISILITFFLTPIITRIFDKSEFGTFYIYVSFVSILGLVVNGMYPYAIVIPKFKKDYLVLVKLSLFLTIIGVAFLYFFFFLFGNQILDLIDAQQLQNYLYLVPIGVLIAALNIIFRNMNIRKERFLTNSTSNVVGSFSDKFFQILSGKFYKPVFPSLIFSKIASDLVRLIILTKKGILGELVYITKKIDKKEVKQALHKYSNYPKYLLPGNLLNTFTSNIPLYVLTSHYGIASVGAFGFANSMLNVPFNVIGNSISSVFFQQANKLYLQDVKKAQKLLISTNKRLLLLGSLAFGIIFAFGDILFAWFFGEKWRIAGKIASILSIFFLIKIISGPLSGIFRVVKKEDYLLYVSIILAVSRVLGIYIGVMQEDLVDAIWFFSIANIFGYLVTLGLIFYSIGLNPFFLILKVILYTGISFLLFYLLRISIIPN